MKSKIRKVIDILMTIFFIILMGYYVTGSEIHEILGTITFVLFIIHHILNIKWYTSIFKGKHNFQRTFQIILNILLFIAMLGMMISGIMISGHIFKFLNIPTTMFARQLHMLSTSWGFILMAIHVGLHITGMMTKLKNKMKDTTFEYVYYFIIILIMAFGLYSFISLKLWEDMFLLVHFKFYDYNQSKILFYLKIIATMDFYALLVSQGMTLYTRFSSRRDTSYKDRNF